MQVKSSDGASKSTPESDESDDEPIVKKLKVGWTVFLAELYSLVVFLPTAWIAWQLPYHFQLSFAMFFWGNNGFQSFLVVNVNNCKWKWNWTDLLTLLPTTLSTRTDGICHSIFTACAGRLTDWGRLHHDGLVIALLWLCVTAVTCWS